MTFSKTTTGLVRWVVGRSSEGVRCVSAICKFNGIGLGNQMSQEGGPCSPLRRDVDDHCGAQEVEDAHILVAPLSRAPPESGQGGTQLENAEVLRVELP